MYRIRVLNSDGTLGGFYSDKGITDDVSLAKTYLSDLDLKDDLVVAYNASGKVHYPTVNYGIDTEQLSQTEKTQFDSSILAANTYAAKTILDQLEPKSGILPPFEDKPSRTFDGQPSPSLIGIIDIDGGFLTQDQEIDLDGGGA